MSLPQTMKAAVVRSFGKPLTIEEMPVPRPADDQILVKIAASGVCHTDLHAAEGDWPVKPHPPFIPGHEGVGYVAAVGKNVKHVKEGDRVGVPWLHSACGFCRHCIGGWETLCESQTNTGYSVNGGFADYALADPNYVGHLPSNVSFIDVAPVLCAGVTVYKGLKVTDAKPGDWVVISGIGGLGHMAVQYAKAMGFNVAAVDIDDSKLALARQLGATVTVNAMNTDPAAYLQREIEGAHRVLVTAVSPKAFEQALGMFRSGKFPEAGQAFAAFLRQWPKSGYTPSVRFWLGNSQYATRDYKNAIANFRSVMTNAPMHARAPEAALSIANCLVELKDTKAARKTLEELLQAYPNSEAAGIAKSKLATLK